MADVLFDPYGGISERALNIESWISLDYEAGGDVVRVYGRPDPVVVTDVRPWPTGTLKVITLDAAERAWMESLLATGRIIGFRPDPALNAGLPATMYLYVGKVTQTRVSRLARRQERIWTLEVTQVAGPVVRT